MVTSLPCTYSTGGKEKGLVSQGHVTALHVQHWGERERACSSRSRHCPACTALGGKRKGLLVKVMSLPCTYSTGGKEKGLVSQGHVIALHVQHWGERERACQSWSHTFSTGGSGRVFQSWSRHCPAHTAFGERETACQSWSHYCCARTVLEEKRKGLSVIVTLLSCTFSIRQEEMSAMVMSLSCMCSTGGKEMSCHCPARTALGGKRCHVIVLHVQHWGERDVMSLSCTYSTGGNEMSCHCPACTALGGKRCQSWSCHCPARTALGGK